jgi:hypothetical protein
MKTATTLAATALAVAVFGSTPLGHAAANLVVPKNSVGTAQLKGNAVTGLKVKDGTLTDADFKAGELPAGTQGPQGPAGPKGEKGDRGVSLYANVTSAGVLESGTASSASRDAKGSYRVTFDGDISKCAATVTAGATGGGSWYDLAFGTAAVAGGYGSHQIAVWFHAKDGVNTILIDTDFHLIVAC